jgi:2-aminoadipate transaminase
MDYAARFSKAAHIGLAQGASAASPPAADTISLAYGLPDPKSFPTDELLEVTRRVLAEQSSSALQYGAAQGDPGLRRYLAERLNEKEGLSLEPEQVVITSGSSQAISMVAQLMVDPGDAILLEGPTFLGAVRVFRLYQPRLEELPLDERGLIIEELEGRLERLAGEGVRPKFLYTQPTFHNPAGVTMPLERRLELLDVAKKHALLVVEDDAYGDLRFEGSDLPTLLALDREGLVIRLGTFSKILAAGLRLGWAAGPPSLMRALPVVKTDSGTSPYSSHLAAEWARSGSLEPHIRKLRGVYRERRDAMLAALERHCAQYCHWTKPEGGFFVWVELNESVDPKRLRQTADEAGVAYLPGTQCFASDRGECFLRLSFSFATPQRIEQAIERLGRAMARAASAGVAPRQQAESRQ